MDSHAPAGVVAAATRRHPIVASSRLRIHKSPMGKKFHRHSAIPSGGTGRRRADLKAVRLNLELTAMANPALPDRRANVTHARRAVRSAGDGGSRGLLSKFFSKFSHTVAHASGTPAAFLVATLIILVWAVSGPIFGYSDTWQLVINTGTTIVTFLMVFLIQNTQNRDTMALQLKLSELIIAVKGAKDSVATIEDLSEEELEQLHQELSDRMRMTRDALRDRKSAE